MTAQNENKMIHMLSLHRGKYSVIKRTRLPHNPTLMTANQEGGSCVRW